MCHYLMTEGLDKIMSQYQFDFSQETQTIYHEFFDSLNYIIEQAIDKNMPNMDSITHFIGFYLQFMHKEREFYLKLFPEDSISRFDHFLSINEYNWVSSILLTKFEPKNEDDYLQFMNEFLSECQKVF